MDFDESQDPELAMVLRISQEEARQAAEAQAARTSGAVAQPVLGEDAGGDYDEDADLAAALALSMQSGGGGSSSAAVHVPAQNHADVGDDAGEDEDDAEMAAALALSMQGSQTLPPQPPASTAAGDAGVDADFVRQMLGQLGDVDPNDPLIAAALAQLGAGPTDSSKADKKRKEPDSK